MPVLLGAIADDFTGATDLANTLVRHGMRTVQLIGTPARRAPEDVDAVVVALKSRTIPAADAIAQSLAALRLAASNQHAADLLQILLDFRIRPIAAISAGCGRADGGARHRSHGVLSGLPGKRPDNLPRISVCRRRAVVRIRDARSSADANARRQSGARARTPDASQGRLGAVAGGEARSRKPCAANSPASVARAAAMPSSTRWTTPIS